jgi:hypothetical protein
MATLKTARLKAKISQSTSGITTPALRFDALADVEEINPSDGSFVVYRASDDKYVVTSTINLSNSTGTLDGGSF